MVKEKSKEVKMDAQAQPQEKLSYEQLEQLAGNLNKQCQQMYTKLQEANRAIAEFNEIGLLLDVLGKAEYFSDNFVSRCSVKIEGIITKAFDEAEKQEEEKK